MATGMVLVVDDDPSIVQVIRYALEDAGYAVVSAANGEALSLAHDLHPGVILLDMMMPRMDGAEVSKRLRAEAKLQGRGWSNVLQPRPWS